MDTFMECYFEEVFSNMGRDCLNERMKRRELVEYFSTVIAGCARGVFCNIDERIVINWRSHQNKSKWSKISVVKF